MLFSKKTKNLEKVIKSKNITIKTLKNQVMELNA